MPGIYEECGDKELVTFAISADAFACEVDKVLPGSNFPKIPEA